MCSLSGTKLEFSDVVLYLQEPLHRSNKNGVDESIVCTEDVPCHEPCTLRCSLIFASHPSTFKSCLMTGIHSEKCAIRLFHHSANVRGTYIHLAGLASLPHARATWSSLWLPPGPGAGGRASLHGPNIRGKDAVRSRGKQDMYEAVRGRELGHYIHRRGPYHQGI